MAAFYHARLPKPEIVEKLKDIAQYVKEELTYRRGMIKHEPELSTKRQKFYRLFGRVSGMILLRKLRSRGLSLTDSA